MVWHLIGDTAKAREAERRPALALENLYPHQPKMPPVERHHLCFLPKRHAGYGSVCQGDFLVGKALERGEGAQDILFRRMQDRVCGDDVFEYRLSARYRVAAGRFFVEEQAVQLEQNRVGAVELRPRFVGCAKQLRRTFVFLVA